MAENALYLPFYFEWNDTLSALTDEDFGRLVRALLDFARTGGEAEEIAEASPLVLMAYKFITSSITRSEKKRADGRKGGIARAKAVREATKETDAKNGENVVALPTETQIEQQNLAKNGEAKAEAVKKNAPTIDEVRGFFRSREFKSNPDEFFNFYESNGWRVGQNLMQNWHSSAENWEIKANRPTNVGKCDEKTQNAPHFEQKRYGDFDIDEAFRLALERSYGPNADLDEE